MLRWLRAAVAALGALPFAVLCVALLATAVMYCGNDNVDPKLGEPRGDGAYRPALARGDGHMHFLITRSIVFDRDFDFDNDLARFGDPWAQPKTVTGRKNVMQQIGPSLVWAPVLGVAHLAALVANVFGADIPTHGYTLFHQRILFATSVLFAWVAIILGVVLARRLLGGRWGPVLAGAATLLGTTLVYYATFMPAYAHAMDAAACAVFLGYWALTIGDLRWRRFVWLGLALGVAAMVRIQDIAFGAVLALELGIALARTRDPKLLVRGLVTLGIAIVLHVPQFYVWNEFYGSWFTTPQGPGQMRYGHPMVLELLFSSRNGWLSTHPIAYAGTLGLVVGAIAGPKLGKHVRLVCGAFLIAIAAQVYINAVTYEWWSAASFGQRRMASSTLPVLVGLAVLLRWAHVKLPRLNVAAKLAIASTVLGWFVAWNLGWTFKLTQGRAAGRDNKPTCCDDVIPPLRWIARPVYRAVGNPFALPASAVFAARHGVDLRRWDQAVGNYALVPGVLGYNDGSYRKATATWNALDERYVIDGMSDPVQRDTGRPYRWTTGKSATLLVPLLMPEPHTITIPLAANAKPGELVYVQVQCNGEPVAHKLVGSTWTTITFETDGSIGENVIEILAWPRPWRGGPPAPAGAEAGVAIGPFRVALPQRGTLSR